MAYVAISQELHGDKRWVRHPSLLFANTDTVAPLLVSDLASAVQALPIGFIKQEQGFVLVVLMGLRADENVLVSSKGEWLSEYMPAIYRSSPFELLAAGDHQVLSIDETCIRDGDGDEGELFFEEGVITDSIRDVFERVQQINATRTTTQNICMVLAEHEILKPWPITISDGPNQQEVRGLYCVDEEALNALPDEKFLALRRTHALPVAYAQLYSMQKLTHLARLAQQRPAVLQQESTQEIFSFAGL